MKVHEDIYVAYIPTPAVLPYNTMIKPDYFSPFLMWSNAPRSTIHSCVKVLPAVLIMHI